MGKPASHCNQHSAGALDHARRQKRQGDVAISLLTLTGVGLGLLSLLPRAPALVWNFSESVPVGLYQLEDTSPARGDVVALRPAGRARAVLDAYAVLPAGRLLLKQIAAMAGDTACRSDTTVTINGNEAAIARVTTGGGRALPVWSGCHRLADEEILVLAPHPASFDGRYLGPIDAGQVIGVARPLITLPSREAM